MDYFKRFINTVKNILSIKLKKKELDQDKSKEKQSRNYEQNNDNVDIKRNADESVYELNSYNKLETYINHLYKLQKKKE